MASISALHVIAAQAPDPANLLRILGLGSAAICILLFLQMMALARFYRIPPPDVAIVRTGHGGFRVAVGSGLFVIPVLHQFGYVNLAVHRFELTGTQLNSDQARSLQLPNVFLIAVGQEEDLIRRAAMRLNQRLNNPEVCDLLVKDIVFAEYERLLSQLNDNPSGDSPATRFIDGIEEALNTVGLTIVSCQRQ